MALTVIIAVIAFAIGSVVFFYTGINYRKNIAENTIGSAEQQAKK